MGNNPISRVDPDGGEDEPKLKLRPLRNPENVHDMETVDRIGYHGGLLGSGGAGGLAGGTYAGAQASGPGTPGSGVTLGGGGFSGNMGGSGANSTGGVGNRNLPSKGGGKSSGPGGGGVTPSFGSMVDKMGNPNYAMMLLEAKYGYG